MTPQELKNSILQLAIQGKLVEQRPEEGTAEELFQKIQEEKQRLIAEKKIKKEKPLPEITEDEKPFDIPESWKWVRLGNCGSWGSGATPSRTNSEYYGGTIPWLKTGDLNDGTITEIPEYITELALEKTSVRLNPIGSVLMAMYGATIGKLGILGIEATTNQACCACIPYEGIYNKFLFYFLMASRTAFIKLGEGGAQPNISKEKIVNALISLPPLAEQKRIVAKIEELLPYIDRYEQAWSKLEQFNSRFPEDMKKSLLQYAIQGKLVEQRPEEGTAEELFQKIQAEKQRLIAEKKIKKEKGEYGEFKEDEILFDIPTTWKWVRFGSIMINRDSERIPLSVAERSKLEKNFDYYGASGVIDKVDRYLFDKTLLLIGEDVANSLTRSTPIAFLAQGQYWVNNHAHVLDCVEGTLSLEYMMYFVNAISLAKYVTGTAQPKMNQEKMNSIPVPLPPLAEQKRIVEKLEELLPLCEQLK